MSKHVQNRWEFIGVPRHARVFPECHTSKNSFHGFHGFPDRMAKKKDIDLGITYSCLDIWKKRQCLNYCSDRGNRSGSSYVALADIERLIGDVAKNQTTRKAENTVFDTQRLINRKVVDSIVQSEMKLRPLKATSGVSVLTIEDGFFRPRETLRGL